VGIEQTMSTKKISTYKPRSDRRLTLDQVREIRESKKPLSVFAKRYKISVVAVYYIRRRFHYKEVL